MGHLFFNLSGILIWFVIPVMRKPPIAAARFLGRTTSKYRWFAVAYIFVCFFLIPLTIFGLSLAGWKVLVGVGVPVLVFAGFVIIITILQNKRPGVLPTILLNWKFLPVWMRSLEPIDRIFRLIMVRLKRIGLCCCDAKTDAATVETITDAEEGLEMTSAPEKSDGMPADCVTSEDTIS